jgi:hypothetical protein
MPALETARQHLHAVDRPVLAAGAADGHGEVAALVFLEGRQPVGQEGSIWSIIARTSGCDSR